MKKARVVLTVIPALLATGALAVYLGLAQPHLISPGDGSGSVMLPLGGGKPYSEGPLTICLDRPGQVTIEKVEFGYGDGLRIDAFGVRPDPGEMHEKGLGSSLRTLREEGFPPASSPVVNLVCKENGGTSINDHSRMELGIQVGKSTDAAAYGSVVVITYRTTWSTQILRIPFSVGLCAARSACPTNYLDHTAKNT